MAFCCQAQWGSDLFLLLLLFLTHILCVHTYNTAQQYPFFFFHRERVSCRAPGFVGSSSIVGGGWKLISCPCLQTVSRLSMYHVCRKWGQCLMVLIRIICTMRLSVSAIPNSDLVTSSHRANVPFENARCVCRSIFFRFGGCCSWAGDNDGRRKEKEGKRMLQSLEGIWHLILKRGWENKDEKGNIESSLT